jgi:hypothetical protein
LICSQVACGKTAPGGKTARGGEASTGGKAPPRDPASTDAHSSEALRGNVVVRVGRRSITRETVDRWTTVEAILTYEHTSGRSVPRGVVPDPPRFENCIEYLETAATTISGQREQKPDRAQLRSRCTQKSKALREQALTTLILHYWIGDEAAKRHVMITQSEVRGEVNRKFTADGERKYLEASGVTAAEERFAVENQVLLTKLQRSTLPVYAELRRARGPETPQMVNRVDFEIQKFGDDIAKRWAPKTHCRNGFVVSECREPNAS